MKLADFVKQVDVIVKTDIGENFRAIHGVEPTIRLGEGDESDDPELRDLLDGLEISGVEMDMFACGCVVGINVVVRRKAA